MGGESDSRFGMRDQQSRRVRLPRARLLLVARSSHLVKGARGCSFCSRAAVLGSLLHRRRSGSDSSYLEPSDRMLADHGRGASGDVPATAGTLGSAAHRTARGALLDPYARTVGPSKSRSIRGTSWCDPVHDDDVLRADFEEHTPVADAKPVLARSTGQSLHVAGRSRSIAARIRSRSGRDKRRSDFAAVGRRSNCLGIQAVSARNSSRLIPVWVRPSSTAAMSSGVTGSSSGGAACRTAHRGSRARSNTTAVGSIDSSGSWSTRRWRSARVITFSAYHRPCPKHVRGGTPLHCVTSAVLALGCSTVAIRAPRVRRRPRRPSARR